jgi:cell division protein FtsB
MHFDSPLIATLFYAIGGIAAVLLLFVGYKFGRLLGTAASTKMVAQKEQELFTAQKGFKQLYETELNTVKEENAALKERVQQLDARVEEYRKKAAGFGGLFNSGGKRADAMYALLLENEALEEALMAQNEKLKQERQDSLKEQMRSTSYRRVLMSQLMNDERIKSYVAEIMADDKRLPGPEHATAGAAPANGRVVHEGEETPQS